MPLANRELRIIITIVTNDVLPAALLVNAITSQYYLFQNPKRKPTLNNMVIFHVDMTLSINFGVPG